MQFKKFNIINNYIILIVNDINDYKNTMLKNNIIKTSYYKAFTFSKTKF